MSVVIAVSSDKPPVEMERHHFTVLRLAKVLHENVVFVTLIRLLQVADLLNELTCI